MSERVVGGLRGINPKLVSAGNRHSAGDSSKPDAERCSIELGEEPPHIVELPEKAVEHPVFEKRPCEHELRLFLDKREFELVG